MRLRPILLGLILSVPVAAVDAIPSTASVGRPCLISWYYNASGYAYRMRATCSPGSTYFAFRARLNCNNGSNVGPWQSNPGPWYGSTATCPSGGHAQGTSYIEFW